MMDRSPGPPQQQQCVPLERLASGERRRLGFSLLELIVALTFMAVGLLGFLSVFYSNFAASESTSRRDEVRVAFDTVSETLRCSDFESLYKTYHGATVNVPALEDPYGAPAKVRITCYVDETSLPAQFGPVLDIDGNGRLETDNCSITYELLPVRLTMTHVDRGVEITDEVYMIVGKKDTK